MSRQLSRRDFVRTSGALVVSFSGDRTRKIAIEGAAGEARELAAEAKPGKKSRKSKSKRRKNPKKRK
jgi:hypothetical protein